MSGLPLGALKKSLCLVLDNKGEKAFSIFLQEENGA